ncbi:DMT family transporter [Streptomyces radicis]|uniref:DMT family transporter n=1 Tax=Streptomyces radicis TaxID=1750517 RepID=UPI001C7DB523|nr:DMT family transporter [Streptomyces radicis]
MTVTALAVAVVSISATAPLTAQATASPLAMAFWRNALGFATLGVLLLVLRRREAARVARRERALLRREQWRPMVFSFLAATSLALHFAAFMTSTRMTTVAISTALVATQPVWQALIAAGQGIRFARRTWMGLVIAVVGAFAAAGPDIQSGGTALLGDLLALAGAVTSAGYAALSQKARADLSTPLYSTVTSLICGLELLIVCWLAGIPLTGFDQSTQLSLLGLLILPQLLGLGAMNFALGRTSATTMSTVLLLETPVAALAAWWLMGQSVEPAALPGLLLIIIGVTVVVRGGDGEPAVRRRGRHRRGAPLPSQAPRASQPPPRVGVSAPATPTAAFAYSGPVSAAPGTVTRRSWPSTGAEGTEADEDESPTLTFFHHGAGAFDSLYTSRHPEHEPPPLDQPTVEIRPNGRRGP